MTLYLAIRDRRAGVIARGRLERVRPRVRVELCECVSACVVRVSYPGGWLQACTHGAMCSAR